MEDAFGDGLDFEVVVASLRLGREHIDTYLSRLAERLDRALPGQVAIDRSGLLSRRTKRITFDLGDKRYAIEHDGHSLHCTASSVVRGVVIKTDDCDLDAWITAVSRGLAQAADSSQETRAALERLLDR